jgi:predicted nucleotidyltransferase
MKPDGPGQSAQLLSEVAVLLDKLGISYAVIGGLAASFHGIVRSSLDADAVISTRETSQLAQLIDRLEKNQLQVSHRKGDFDDPIDAVVAVTDGHLNKVDLLTGIRGLSQDFVSRTIPISLFGGSLQIIGLEDFIAMKIFAGAPRDIQDARAALQVSREMVDKSLLLQLARQYGSNTAKVLEELLSEEEL